MLNFDQMAKGAVQGLQKAEKLAGLSGKVPEQVTAALRRLIAEAKQLTGSPAKKNGDLDACIQKAQALLESGDMTTEAVTKLTAELGALIKGVSAGNVKQAENSGNSGTQKARTPSGADTGRNAAAVPKPAPKAAAAPQPSKPVQFSDVDTGAYYYDAVQWAVQQGIASGTTETTFSPDQNCTRAQTITLLWRAAGSPAPKSQNNPFTDVKDSAYYGSAVLWAAERGIVSGTAFHPDEAVTRGQMAAFLYREAGSPAVKAGSAFTDVPGDAYYCQAVAWVAAQGITSGTGEHTFSPDAVCTRGQIVTFLYRARK